MRFPSIVLLLLASQLLVGCELFQRASPPAEPAVEVPSAQDSPPQVSDQVPADQCPPQEVPVCAEPEVKVVERVIERSYEKLVEVPVAKDKLVLGSVEYFAIEPGGLRVTALIDTGAPTSSLTTEELTPFERDGAEWVRFKLAQPKKGSDKAELELPVKRYIKVARPGFESQRRPVVDLSLTVGDITHMVEVNLAGRSELEYPLLVGRNFLKDLAVIDVSRRHVQGEPRPGVQK